MSVLRLVLAAAAFLVATAATAAPVTVQILGADGRPLAGAVVTLTMPGTPPPVPRGPYQMVQRNIAFAPHILIVPVGARVSLPNLDRVRHHVYSFSPVKRFDLKLYGRDESRSVVFDKPGAVPLGCNIHDAMSGVIYVTATPYAAITDANGRVSFSTSATGRAVVAVWHPAIRRAGNTMSQGLNVAAGGASTALRIS